MKKLILTTSALTLMGVASSASAGGNFTLSADASASWGNWETGAGGSAAFDYDTGVTIALEAAAGALTWGAEVGIDADAGTVDDGVIWMDTGLWKFLFGIDEFDELSASSTTSGSGFGAAATDGVNGTTTSDAHGDVKVEGSFGAVGVTLVVDAGMGRTPGGTGYTPGSGISSGADTWDLGLTFSGNNFNASLDTASDGDWDLAADTSFGNVAVGASVDEASTVDVWASTTFGGINAKLNVDDVSGAPVYGLGLDGSSGMMSWSVFGDSGGAAEASVSYDADPWTASLTYDNDDAGCVAGGGACAGTTNGEDYGDEADLIFVLGYKANDAVSFEIKANDQGESEVSMSLAFVY